MGLLLGGSVLTLFEVLDLLIYKIVLKGIYKVRDRSYEMDWNDMWIIMVRHIDFFFKWNQCWSNQKPVFVLCFRYDLCHLKNHIRSSMQNYTRTHTSVYTRTGNDHTQNISSCLHHHHHITITIVFVVVKYEFMSGEGNGPLVYLNGCHNSVYHTKISIIKTWLGCFVFGFDICSSLPPKDAPHTSISVSEKWH